MTVPSNVSENENAVFRVQVWLNGIVEAFDDGNREMPIKPQITHTFSGKLWQGIEGVTSIRFTTHGQATVQPQGEHQSRGLHLGVLVFLGQIVLL